MKIDSARQFSLALLHPFEAEISAYVVTPQALYMPLAPNCILLAPSRSHLSLHRSRYALVPFAHLADPNVDLSLFPVSPLAAVVCPRSPSLVPFSLLSTTITRTRLYPDPNFRQSRDRVRHLAGGRKDRTEGHVGEVSGRGDASGRVSGFRLEWPG